MRVMELCFIITLSAHGSCVSTTILDLKMKVTGFAGQLDETALEGTYFN